MNNIEDRLVNCFSLVFADVPREQIASATAENLKGWDSVAHLNLLSLIGEEFGMDIDFEEFEGATSFAALLDRVREITARA